MPTSTKNSPPCPRCQDTQWTRAGLCYKCEAKPVLDRVRIGRLSIPAAHAELDRLERPDCYQPRTGLKDEMVAELEAIQRRVVFAAGCVA